MKSSCWLPPEVIYNKAYSHSNFSSCCSVMFPWSNEKTSFSKSTFTCREVFSQGGLPDARLIENEIYGISLLKYFINIKFLLSYKWDSVSQCAMYVTCSSGARRTPSCLTGNILYLILSIFQTFNYSINLGEQYFDVYSICLRCQIFQNLQWAMYINSKLDVKPYLRKYSPNSNDVFCT